jgi:hypothetical protein
MLLRNNYLRIDDYKLFINTLVFRGHDAKLLIDCNPKKNSCIKNILPSYLLKASDF